MFTNHVEKEKPPFFWCIFKTCQMFSHKHFPTCSCGPAWVNWKGWKRLLVTHVVSAYLWRQWLSGLNDPPTQSWPSSHVQTSNDTGHPTSVYVQHISTGWHGARLSLIFFPAVFMTCVEIKSICGKVTVGVGVKWQSGVFRYSGQAISMSCQLGLTCVFRASCYTTRLSWAHIPVISCQCRTVGQ